MSQHDFDLANNTGAVFRADLNLAIAAIISQSSGATEPTAMFAYMFWFDTTTTILKQRNSANNAWVSLMKVGAATAQHIAALGSVSAPSLYFDGDTNTGIFSNGADKVNLVAGGTDFLEADGTTGVNLKGTGAVKAPVGTTAQRPSASTGMLRYNSDLTKFEGYNGTLWTSLGGGGGGAGFTWKTLGGTAPIILEENSEQVAVFGNGLAQELYAAVKVPSGYIAGTQIFIYVSSYSVSTSNTQLFRAQSTLIRKGTDAFTSTTNQRTTTNAALTNTVTLQLREHVLDITDSSGQINSVSVSAGDIIKVRLYRDTDSDTNDVKLITNATDAKFA